MSIEDLTRVDWFGWWTWVLLALIVVGFYLRSLAGRLDRLHLRWDAARDALDAQLVRRAAAAAELGASTLIDPASALLLAEAAHDAREAGAAGDRERGAAESDLSSALRLVFDDPDNAEEIRERGGEHILDDLATGCQRVVYALRFYNDAVDATQAMRSKALVRWFRLAGYTPWPEHFAMDDTPPAALAQRP